MNSDDIILRSESYPPLATKGSGLTATQFDDNNIAIYKDFQSLAVTIGVPAYDAGTTYNNDPNDSETETFATYSSRFWQWINVVDGQSTPAEGSDWTEVFPTMLAHEKNKDDKLKTLDGFTVEVTDTPIPKAVVEFDDPASDWEYSVGVQDVTGSGGDKQCSVNAFNSATNESIGVRITDGLAEIKHANSGTTTAAVRIEDSKVFFKTPDVLSATASVGYVPALQAADGEIEFIDPASSGLRIGLVDYNDAATAVTPITVTAATPTVITNDTLGVFTNTAYLPSGVTSIWDALTDSFDWSELDLGDMIDIRLDLDIITSSVNTVNEVDLILGTGGGVYSIPFVVEKNFKDVSTHKVNRFNGIYMGDNNTLNNGGQFKVTSDKNCSVIVNGWYCKIIKN